MTRKCWLALIALFLAVPIACSGSLKGVVRQDARRVSFDYSDSKIGTADIKVALPEGERFAGAVKRGTEQTAGESGASNSSDRFEAVETFDGNADAVLTGNRGNIMKCRFNLTDIIIGFSSGGFGICQVADGRVIDIFF
jgi:hypothetical protein